MGWTRIKPAKPARERRWPQVLRAAAIQLRLAESRSSCVLVLSRGVSADVLWSSERIIVAPSPSGLRLRGGGCQLERRGRRLETMVPPVTST